ncbi:MAG: Rho termination factor N-terminal domain-containing protein [Faecousia sp.]
MATMEEKLAQVEAQAAAKTATAAKDDDDLITGHLDTDQLKGMKMSELKALANDLGLKYAFNIKKDDLVAMIDAEPVQAEKAAIVEDVGNTEAAPEAADGLIVGVDLEAATEAGDQDGDPVAAGEDLACVDVKLKGRAMVTYTGMVNLRDETLAVVDQVMQLYLIGIALLHRQIRLHAIQRRTGACWICLHISIIRLSRHRSTHAAVFHFGL